LVIRIQVVNKKGKKALSIEEKLEIIKRFERKEST
jgi:hypothetical protein